METLLSGGSIEDNLKRFLLVVLIALLVATLSRLSGWFRPVPYTLLLVIAGLLLAFADVRLVELSPELILLVFLPPLLFQAAWDLEWTSLKRNWIPIALFAVARVAITIAGTAWALEQWAGTSLAVGTLSLLSNILARSRIQLGEQTVLWWGGLRGSASIASPSAFRNPSRLGSR